MRIVVTFMLATLYLLGGSVPAGASPKKKQKISVDEPTEVQTRLRPGEPAVVVGRSSRGLELRHLNVEVRNVGRHTATGVSVFVECAGGLVYQLRGPTTLRANQRAVYLTNSHAPLLRQSGFRIVARCATCRRP